MNYLRRLLLSSMLAIFASMATYAETHYLNSPDGNISVRVYTEPTLQWEVLVDKMTILERSVIGYDFTDLSSGKKFSIGGKIKGETEKVVAVDEEIDSPVYFFSKTKNKYYELQLNVKNAMIYFRAYDDGVAYRVELTNNRPCDLNNETVEMNFSSPSRMIVPYVNDNRSGERYCFSFEAFYDEVPGYNLILDSLFYTPFLVDFSNNLKACFIEADVRNYPGLFAKKGKDGKIVGELPLCVVSQEIGGYDSLNLIPTTRSKTVVAHLSVNQKLPWRGMTISRNDIEIPCNTLAYKLSTECKLDDVSWIRPGKVAWDWWNDLNLTDVDFEPGINTQTYKHYIDFASQNAIEYIILDEGWSDKNDLYKVVSDIDLDELIAYGKEKNVSIILWATWRNVIKNTDKVFDFYAKKGVAGFKIDFFDRNDQNCVASMEEIARLAALHKLVVDYHGAKPFGHHRMYPNIINFEGVKGAENYKWEQCDGNGTIHNFPKNDVLVSFLRNLEGPVDYTPGAMDNATRKTFECRPSSPMSATTRAHQAALYTGYYAPLQMLADSPSKYRKDQQFTGVITSLPTTYDSSVCLDANVDQYVVTARKSGDSWYVSGINSENENEITLDFSFLDTDTEYEATILRDGDDANDNPSSYVIETLRVDNKTKKKIILKQAGGFICIIKK